MQYYGHCAKATMIVLVLFAAQVDDGNGKKTAGGWMMMKFMRVGVQFEVFMEACQKCIYHSHTPTLL